MKKVLIIEDNPEFRENTVELLELCNYEVIAAENGRVGIQMAMTALPDIIICDIVMPEANGYTVLEVLGQNERTAGIPFIFLTAKDQKEDIRRGLSLGADDYIYKPFKTEELLKALEIRLKKNDFLRQRVDKNSKGLNLFLKEASAYLDEELLSSSRKNKHFKDRDIIFREGDAAHHLYFVEKGNVKTYRVAESGKEIVTGWYGPGDFFGQLSLLGKEGIYIESAVTMEYAEVLDIPKQDFVNLIHHDMELANKFLEIISSNTVHLQEKLIDIAYSSVNRRTAKALLELHEKGILKDENQKGVDILREDLASMIGVAKETAIRTLTKFKEIGLIGTDSRKKLTLLDKEKLQRIADFED
ncbi:MAG: response regulator [Bacteroidota bacterium]|uniref:Response regulator n=1 Tax=Flagellimonas profundi TaxID=2915620 RepID=A0ABS3FBB1_9FLAO|nr:response regulator [Allomuricauda profundi]MBO0340313.1 response regulator [Allomuricauda profundi]MEC7771495.1 response regulator [Bacteroidota bacterium]